MKLFCKAHGFDVSVSLKGLRLLLADTEASFPASEEFSAEYNLGSPMHSAVDSTAIAICFINGMHR